MHFLFHIESSLFVQEMPMNYSIIWLILLLVKANLFVVLRLYCIYISCDCFSVTYGTWFIKWKLFFNAGE